MTPMYLKSNPHSCSKCGGIVRVFCPMEKESKPCSPISTSHKHPLEEVSQSLHKYQPSFVPHDQTNASA